MSLEKPDGCRPRAQAQTGDLSGVHTQLVEALIHILIEKGVLTGNDALDVVQTVAEVQHGLLQEDRVPKAQTRAGLEMLQRMYASFEGLNVGLKVHQAAGENVHLLRPPLHADGPRFPRGD